MRATTTRWPIRHSSSRRNYLVDPPHRAHESCAAVTLIPNPPHHHRTPNQPQTPEQANTMTALFNFQSLLVVLLLTICTSTYAHYVFPSIIDSRKENYFVGPIWKCARIGERLSPYVSLACFVMAALEFIG
ncbi:DUF1242-domain-containing protein [Lentithecium fluviatile CBS 122367]|uniref:DUF1242-domain-containing protein n=1 Tax=Lentithecium fluviatile CBS 122367 TaxID=1168545 RepID=A0A6G1JNH4_9PLEO|nr:DUF1242-domain-containing protein [Lentithecium fluviatile CBS 122367]